ncbi:family 1 encapsulin nanocompartment shell protein [Flexivirga caeni]|uniref:Type 1 encapsulin shell protein n=1 Tax=Flexivirga caeni TaxID=2294115 RepID=A0A3M9MEA5_9MICO|nr:family 1 encapsulin nanocompartment shell protein [Flexivirga caeni]RNI23901.1 bacteriocin [Flexivirga caeni]
MNNLHRELAPISDAAWGEIEEEARRSFSIRAAARRVVDVPEPRGVELAAVGTGHFHELAAPSGQVLAKGREARPVVEFRARFTVSRTEVDNVERGAQDSDWQPVKDAAAALAYAEDRTVFYGSSDEQIAGMAPESTNARISLPQDVTEAPAAVASAINTLRLADVAGPYSLLLSPELYTALSETTDHGYPVRDHVARLLGDGHLIWAPAVDGALLVSERGGDYTLQLGQDVSIGYLSHDADTVELYLQESLTFLINTAEACVTISS